VVLIISAGITIAVPKYADSLKRTRVAQCEFTRQITDQADARYSFDHDGETTTLAGLANEDYLEVEPRCTANGTFAWVTLESGSRVLACSLHGWGAEAEDEADAPVAQPVPQAPFDPEEKDKKDKKDKKDDKDKKDKKDDKDKKDKKDDKDKKKK